MFEDLKKSILRIECRNHYCQVVFWLHFPSFLIVSIFLSLNAVIFLLTFLSLIPPSFFFYIFIQHTLPLSSLALSLLHLLLLFIPYISLSFSSCTFRLNNTAGQFKCDSKLEISLLNYFKSFKKIYMVDTANTGMSIVPGGTYVTDQSFSYYILSICLCVTLYVQFAVLFLIFVLS